MSSVGTSAGTSTAVAVGAFPIGSAANFVEVAASYTSPAGNVANLSEETGVLRANALRSTNFGTPLAPYKETGWLATHFGAARANFIVYATGATPSTTFSTPRWGVIEDATGWQTTTFGSPAIEPHAMPIYSTQFGTPHSPYLQTGTADGIYSTNLSTGHRLAHIGLVFASIPSTTFSLAYTATNQTAEATGVSRSVFGRARYLVPPDITDNLTLFASGDRNTTFGTPHAPYTQAKTASGFSTTRYGWPGGYELHAFSVFGTPSVEILQPATALGPVAQFGTPAIMYRATALEPVASFGTAVAVESHVASTVERRARFGTPVAFLGGHLAYGINMRARFGRPTSTNRIGRVATGWTATALGEPAGSQNHHATFLPPVARFGTPLLTRSQAC